MERLACRSYKVRCNQNLFMLDDKISCISKGKSHSFIFVSISYLVRLEMWSDAWSWLLSLIIAHASHYTRKTAVWMTAMAFFYQRSRFLADLGGIEERSGIPIKSSRYRLCQITPSPTPNQKFQSVSQLSSGHDKHFWFKELLIPHLQIDHLTHPMIDCPSRLFISFPWSYFSICRRCHS